MVGAWGGHSQALVCSDNEDVKQREHNKGCCGEKPWGGERLAPNRA